MPTRDLAAGWQLALDLGRPAAPVLWELVQAERADVGRRLVVLAAAVLAGGSLEDERLFAFLAQQKPMLEERTLAGLLLALGPRRSRAVPELWSRLLGPSRSPEMLLAISARLAAARFPEIEAGAPPLVGEDPGLAAATAFAGLPVPASIASRWWQLRDPPRHAELFWRGAMLGAARKAGAGIQMDGLRDRAIEVQQLPGDANALARAAAVHYRARRRDLRADGARFDHDLLRAAVFDLASAEALQSWLAPMPLPRDEEPHRLAVAYALSRPVGTVIADREHWAREPRIHKHVAVALAWRLLAAQPAEADLPVVPGLAEWNLVRWAAGAEVDRTATCDDSVLQMAMQLAVDDRLPRRALRQALEETLWRWGSHPGRTAYEQERLLVRDLLLSGSRPGGGKYLAHVRPDQRYSPTGLDRNDGFFTVAVALFDFLARPRGPMPPEHSLSG